MTIEVDEWYNEDGHLNLTISWDENDPLECRLSDWTAEDFLTAIKNECDKELFVGYSTRTTNSGGLYTSAEGEGDIS